MCQNIEIFSKMAISNSQLLPIVKQFGLIGPGYVEPTVWGGSCLKSPTFYVYFRVGPTTSTIKERNVNMAQINRPSEPKGKETQKNGHCSVGPNR